MQTSVELDLALKQIVDAVNKDTNAYQFMKDPVIYAVMRSTDSLLATLEDNPMDFMQILESNKPLQSFWDSFPRIWVILLEHLLDMIAGPYNASIYAFLLVAYHKHQTLCGNDKVLLLDALRLNTSSSSGCEILSRYNQETIDSRNTQYWLSYYDPITARFVSLTQKLQLLFPLIPLFAFPSISEYFGLTEYGRFVFFTDFMITDSEENARSVSYSLDSLRKQVNRIADELASFQINEQGKLVNTDRVLRDNYPEVLIDSIIQVRELARRLQLLVVDNPFKRTPLVIPPPTIVPLTPDLALPYKEVLYDNERGIYRTPTQQKELFVQTLSQASQTPPKSRVDELSAPLPCMSCYKQTMQVDTFLLLPFCTSYCHSVYLSHHKQ